MPRVHVQASIFSYSAGLNKVTPAFIPGAFNGALTTDVRQIEQADDTTNLGRLTFNQFKPTDTKVQLGQFTGGSYAPRAETGLPDLYRGPFEGMPQGYCLFTHFRVVEDGKSPDDCLHGVMTAIAEYDVPGGDKPAAMTIKFSCLMRSMGGSGGLGHTGGHASHHKVLRRREGEGGDGNLCAVRDPLPNSA
eukprot:1153022-Pelagomonas_calceolata.AAC.4